MMDQMGRGGGVVEQERMKDGEKVVMEREKDVEREWRDSSSEGREPEDCVCVSVSVSVCVSVCLHWKRVIRVLLRWFFQMMYFFLSLPTSMEDKKASRLSPIFSVSCSN